MTSYIHHNYIISPSQFIGKNFFLSHDKSSILEKIKS